MIHQPCRMQEASRVSPAGSSNQTEPQRSSVVAEKHSTESSLPSLEGPEFKYHCRTCGVPIIPTTHQIKKSDWVCGDCQRAYQRKWGKQRRAQGFSTGGKASPEWFRAYWREYGQRPDVKKRKAAHMRQYRKDPTLRTRFRARWLLSHALAAGKIVKLPCKVCGARDSQAHHPDYDQPLMVVWLCLPCHRKEHAKAEGSE